MKLRICSKVLCVTVLLPSLGSSAAQGADAAPEPAIKGYCPVTFFTAKQAVPGKREYQATHGGRVYYMATEVAKALFVENPSQYLPEFDGLCTTALGGSWGNRNPSDPTVFDLREGKLYLFGSARAKAAYDRKPEEYIAKAQERFSEPAVKGNCVVSSQKQNKLVAGRPEFTAPYEGWLYRFADAESLAEFLKDPGQYVPRYGGLCVVGVSLGKRYPADGSRMRVVNGKTYLLFDADAEKAFDENPRLVIERADASWPTVKDQK